MNKRIPTNVARRLLVALASWLVANSPALAAGWEQRDFESPLGDKVSGIAVASSNEPGFVLAIGCDGERGDRWRGVAILQAKESSRELENPVPGPTKRQRVEVSFGGPAAGDTFDVRKTPVGNRILSAPEPSKFARRLIDEEKRSPGSSLDLTVFLANGQPLAVRFPLAGLGAAFPDLSKRCRDWQP